MRYDIAHLAHRLFAITLLLLGAVSLCSCHDDEDSWLESVASVTLSPEVAQPLDIYEGETVSLTYQVEPREMAKTIAHLSADCLWYEPDSPTEARLRITAISADTDSGTFTVSVVHSGTSAVNDYHFTLLLGDGDRTLRASSAHLRCQQRPEPEPLGEPGISLSAEGVSQLLAE